MSKPYILLLNGRLVNINFIERIELFHGKIEIENQKIALPDEKYILFFQSGIKMEVTQNDLELLHHHTEFYYQGR